MKVRQEPPARKGYCGKQGATSPSHINAMDMNKEYGDGANPVILKSEFIMSLCEQLIGGNNLGAKQKSIIDRCTASVYRTYQQNDYTGTVPTLQDFRAELLKQRKSHLRLSCSRTVPLTPLQSRRLLTPTTALSATIFSTSVSSLLLIYPAFCPMAKLISLADTFFFSRSCARRISKPQCRFAIVRWLTEPI